MMHSNTPAHRPVGAKKPHGFNTHAFKNSYPAGSSNGAAPLVVPRPRSHKVSTPQIQRQVQQQPEPRKANWSHNPYSSVSTTSLEKVLPAKFYRQLAPSHLNPHPHQSLWEQTLMDKLLHGGSFISFHTWESIHQNKEYEEEVMGIPSPLQSMQALTEQLSNNGLEARQSSTRFGCHMGQFLQQSDFYAENFLTLRLLADLSGVTLYKCDFDAKNCCRVFLDGPHSYERLVAWNKRLRVTPYGVLVAHTEAAAEDLERVHLGNKHEKMPYHTIPIEAMRTSHEMNQGNTAAQRTNQTRQAAVTGFQYQQPTTPVKETAVHRLSQSALLCSVADEIKMTPDHHACRDGMTPSPSPSSTYASDCDPTPVKSSSF